MFDIGTLLLLSLVIFGTHFIGALTGFGATVLAMPFTIALIGIEIGKPMLVIFGVLQPLGVLIANRSDILWSEVIKILFIVCIGMPVGIIFYNYLPQDMLLALLSVFMIFVSVKGLLELRGYEFATPKDFVLNILLFAGGIIHGAFVSGGPLLMIYSSEKIKDKNQFRTSMSVIWVVLNVILLVEGIINHSYNAETLKYTFLALPSLLIGIYLGNKLSSKVNQKVFKVTIYIVLLISALMNFL